MTQLPVYKVDAFADAVFRGNPAAVCPLSSWLPDETMAAIAAENNLSETAFLVREGEGWRLRWFTPTVEVDLCGHATIASAFVLWNRRGETAETLAFETRSGRLTVTRTAAGLVLDLPRIPVRSATAPAALLKGLGQIPQEVLVSPESENCLNYIAVYRSEDEVRTVSPDLRLLGQMEGTGVIVTAAGRSADFVSRYFVPAFGIAEDPVTGAIHAALTPFWSQRLGRNPLRARQLSARGGEMSCEWRGDRVRLTAGAVLYLEGTITLP